ncbi:MAG: polysaccharide pyruvyl transferase CsaB [Clostridiales bacterium]|jgi:polysaccharide pyruvyl transferase CsaB|nr:polysaccharide pyruvyl transferase CsaB [Clostridiales bacterium]
MRKILLTLMGMEIGGAETHVVELAVCLKKRGWDVTVASNGGVYEAELARAGVAHFCVPLHNKNPFNMFSAYRALKRMAMREKFDIIHAHARIPAFICGLVARACGIPFITTAHWVFKAYFPFNIISDWGERTMAVSNDIKQYLIDNYNMPARKIDVTINGVDTEKFSPGTDYKRIERELGLQRGKKRIVYVSRMDSDRSAVAFMLTDALVMLKNPDLQAIIVGGGDDLERLERYAGDANRKLGRNAIIVTGARTDINECVACGDIFVGVSRAALEGMAAGKPTIIAGNEGYIGIISPQTFDAAFATNFCCRGCEEATSELLVRDISALIDADNKDMKEYNRKLILERYSIDKMTDDYELAYHKLGQKTVIISGYYGYRNIGDDCLLSAIFASLDASGLPMDITVLSRNPQETQKLCGARSISRFNILKIIRAMKKGKGNRLLISGGGSILQDITSTKSILYYLFIISLAKWLKMRVFVYANGIGPINLPKNRQRTKRVLSKADAITLREMRSLKELEIMGVECGDMRVTADPAFSLVACGNERAEQILAAEGVAPEEKYFIVAVRPWTASDVDFVDKIVSVCQGCREKYGFAPLFLVMQPCKDRRISRDICGKVSGGKIINGNYDVSEILGIVSKAEFVVGMRLHSIVYAAAQSVPFIGIAYDPKINAVAAEFSEALLHDVGALNSENLLQDIDYIIENRDKISKKLAADAAEMRSKTNEDGMIAAGLLS